MRLNNSRKLLVLLSALIAAAFMLTGAGGCSSDPNVEGAKLDLRNKDYDRALNNLDIALEADPDNVEALKLKGTVLLEMAGAESDPDEHSALIRQADEAWERALALTTGGGDQNDIIQQQKLAWYREYERGMAASGSNGSASSWIVSSGADMGMGGSAAADRRQEGQLVAAGQRCVPGGEPLVDRHPDRGGGIGGLQLQLAPDRCRGGSAARREPALLPAGPLAQVGEQQHAQIRGVAHDAVGLAMVSHNGSSGSGAVGLAMALLTVSDSRTRVDDRSGDALQARLEAAGHQLVERLIVPDDRYRIRAELSRWIADPAVQVVISSGGTGLTGRDGTPEAVAPLLDKTIEGFGELFRVLSFETIGTSSLQSRCLAGVANGTVIFVLPGSLDAVETAWDRLIRAQLDATTRPCNLAALLPRLAEPPDRIAAPRPATAP
jgi:molybdenum cofactor biosynthesis protein B